MTDPVDQETFKAAVIAYLNFSEENKDLAEEIAGEALAWSDSMASERLSFEQQVAFASRACIRHTYTAYDDVLIENTLEQSDITMGKSYEESYEETDVDAVTEFIQRHRKGR